MARSSCSSSAAFDGKGANSNVCEYPSPVKLLGSATKSLEYMVISGEILETAIQSGRMEEF